MNIEFTRNYLTAEEIEYIISQMLEKNTEFERELVKVGIVAQLLIKDFSNENYESCNEIYNKLAESNALNDFYHIINYCTIDEMVMEELSTANIVKKLLKEIEEKIDGLDINEFNDSIEQLKKTIAKKEV